MVKTATRRMRRVTSNTHLEYHDERSRETFSRLLHETKAAHLLLSTVGLVRCDRCCEASVDMQCLSAFLNSLVTSKGVCWCATLVGARFSHRVFWAVRDSFCPSAEKSGSSVGNCNSQDGWTPLHFAAWGGHDAVIEALYGAGADVNACDKVMLSTLSSLIHKLHCVLAFPV